MKIILCESLPKSEEYRGDPTEWPDGLYRYTAAVDPYLDIRVLVLNGTSLWLDASGIKDIDEVAGVWARINGYTGGIASITLETGE